MPLINLTTNLKSLKYSKDTRGGGTSNQPYIKTSIPDGFAPQSRDFLLRNGILNVTNSAQDVSRLTQMFFDTRSPNGVLFTAKQNILSASNVRTQAGGILNNGVYTPLSTIAQAAVVSSGGHLNKQGLDPTGLTSLSLRTYTDAVKPDQDKNSNRLVQLNASKNAGINITNASFVSTLTGTANSISPFPNESLSYIGGPGADLGVGITALPLLNDQRTSTPPNYSVDNFYTRNLVATYSQNQLLTQTPISQGGTVGDFRKTIIDSDTGRQTFDRPGYNLTKGPSYNPGDNKTIEGRVNLGNPGTRKSYASYTTGSGVALDKINALPLYESSEVTNNDVKNDLVKFRIAAINNDDPNQKVFMHFRAFLNSITDNYSPEWENHTYTGLGEKMYNYLGFTRTVDLSWTVYAQSKEELIPMYKKLNYLASNTMPDYSSFGYMRGPLIQLTIGGYFYEQPGFISGLSFEMPEESTWEIGINDEGDYDSSVKELTHMIKVNTFSFTPIHTFRPQKAQWNNLGATPFIALSNGENTNYN